MRRSCTRDPPWVVRCQKEKKVRLCFELGIAVQSCDALQSPVRSFYSNDHSYLLAKNKKNFGYNLLGLLTVIVRALCDSAASYDDRNISTTMNIDEAV